MKNAKVGSRINATLSAEAPVGPPQWKSSYNCHELCLASGAVKIHANWNATDPKGSPSGYRVSCNGRVLIELSISLESAKKAGIALARRILTEAMVQIETISIGPTEPTA